jgi:hypothetical protein
MCFVDLADRCNVQMSIWAVQHSQSRWALDITQNVCFIKEV